MKTKITLIKYYIETLFTKCLKLFNIKYDTSVIPTGMYCYTNDIERNKTNPLTEGYWTKTCPYYRSTNETKGIACTFEGFYGFDVCLNDQCKICGINE